ncbi:MAG: hypothetical protein Q4C03_03820 [bacterium]|nr:hypothetical protein [bacterium]
MYFSNLTELPTLAQTSNFTIFAANPAEALKILQTAYKSQVLVLNPDDKTNKISVEAVRDFLKLTESTETSPKFFVVKNAETLNSASSNALLKSLEEPKSNHFFILLTPTPSALLPTILSRGQLFYQKELDSLNKPLTCDAKIKDYAKQLISADPKTLIALATDLSKKKDNARAYAQAVTAAAIEMLYKTYFLTNQEKYLKKLPGLLKLHENLSKNGHIKLQIVANLI